MRSLREVATGGFEQLKKIGGGPRFVAGGAAIGMFWGFTPLTGLKTLLAVFSAWVLRRSKVSAALAIAFHDLLTPLWPLILRWEYDLGYWMLSNPHRLPKRVSFEGLHIRNWFHLKTLTILWPTFMGSLVFAIPMSVITYWVVRISLERGAKSMEQGSLTPAEEGPTSTL